MSLLVEYTPDGGNLIRLSNQYLPLTHRWQGLIIKAPSFKMAMSEKYGGLIAPTFSDMTVSPKVFSSNWPPPKSGSITIKYTPDTEANARLIFDGRCTIDASSPYSQDGIPIIIRPVNDDTTVPNGTVFSDTLVNVFSVLCNSSYMNLTLDTSLARSISPDVSYTVQGDQKTRDLAKRMAAFFGHAFKIVNGTLYLIDLLPSGSGTVFNNFKIFKSKYANGWAVKSVKCGDYKSDGNSPEGEEFVVPVAYHTTEANILNALNDLVTILEKGLAIVPMRIKADMPDIGEFVTVKDTTLEGNITANVFLTEAIYDWDARKVQFTGIGGIS